MSISAVVQQNNAPWGVSRVSTGQVSLKGFDPLALQYPYFADETGGAGTDVYVLDTGIRTTHDEFGGRATFLQTFGTGVPGQDINGRAYSYHWKSRIDLLILYYRWHPCLWYSSREDCWNS